MTADGQQNLPWSEKYRPRALHDVVAKPILKQRLLDLTQMNPLPNLLFVGPSGTGKTSTAMCLAHYNPGVHSLEINAGNERCVTSIRAKVIDFARKKTSNVKIIVLDEVNSMPSASQHVLKGIMDMDHSNSFILCCNDSDKLLPTIQSRCLHVQFNRIPDGLIIEKLTTVAAKENVKATRAGLQSLVENCNGDLRVALNTLQSQSKLGRITSLSIQEQNLTNCSRLVDKLVICVLKAKPDFRAYELMSRLLKSGQSHGEIFENLIRSINSMLIPPVLRRGLVRHIIACQQRDLEGCTSALQMYSLTSKLMGLHKA